MPTNLGKQLIHAFAGGLQGGELDGHRGVLKLAGEKLRSYIELSLALLSRHRWSEFYQRHWTGKTAFMATFKRSMFSGIANVFDAIERARKGPINPTPEVIDEIMCLLVESPVTACPSESESKGFPRDKSRTDASPTGGGSATVTAFKAGPDPHGPMISFDGKCSNCGRDFGTPIPTRNEGRSKYPCPVGCGAVVCSVRCAIDHREHGCAGDMCACPLFGERFSGPHPLTKAVAMTGIGVQPPWTCSCRMTRGIIQLRMESSGWTRMKLNHLWHASIMRLNARHSQPREATHFGPHPGDGSRGLGPAKCLEAMGSRPP